jgi:hypothetical protein
VPRADDLSRANQRQHGGDHYRSKPIQVWDFVHRNGIGYLAGNVIRYAARYKDKNGLEDLLKCLHYVEKLLEEEYGWVRPPDKDKTGEPKYAKACPQQECLLENGHCGPCLKQVTKGYTGKACPDPKCILQGGHPGQHVADVTLTLATKPACGTPYVAGRPELGHCLLPHDHQGDHQFVPTTPNKVQQ